MVNFFYAKVAELADAPDLGSGGMTVGVRVREGAPWPVGQVVKTEASHAFNIGSNPVRVTK